MSNIADTAGIRVELLRGGKGVGALHVKGIGELPNVPTAAAIANAVADAVGVRLTRSPLQRGLPGPFERNRAEGVRTMEQTADGDHRSRCDGDEYGFSTRATRGQTCCGVGEKHRGSSSSGKSSALVRMHTPSCQRHAWPCSRSAGFRSGGIASGAVAGLPKPVLCVWSPRIKRLCCARTSPACRDWRQHLPRQQR